MKILLCFARNEYTTARYFEDVLRRMPEHQVATAGVNATNIKTEQIVMLPDVIKKLNNEKPDLIIHMQGAFNQVIYGMEYVDCPKVFYGIDTHMVKDYLFEEAKKYDYVFFAQDDAVKEYKERTKSEAVFWLPCCAEPNIHLPLDIPVTHDVAFVGSIDMAQAHLERRNMLKSIQEAGHKLLIGKAMGIWLSYCYAKAKIVFNISVKKDLNMRFFEAMACKKMLLTDKLPDISGVDKLFKEGEDFIAYTDQKDMLEKLQYYLINEGDREKIALNGFNKVKELHTYNKRTKEMLCQIKK